MHLAYFNKQSNLDESLTYFNTYFRLLSWKTNVDGCITCLTCDRNSVMSELQGFCLSAWRIFVHPENLQMLLLAIENATERRTMFVERFHVVGSYLKVRSFLVLGAPRFSENNELLGYFGTISDVTKDERMSPSFNRYQSFLY